MLIFISQGQVRGARGMLGWSLMDLANAAKVSVSSIKRFETEGRKGISEKILNKIKDAFETNGIAFLPDEGLGLGLRLQISPGVPVFSSERACLTASESQSTLLPSVTSPRS